MADGTTIGDTAEGAAGVVTFYQEADGDIGALEGQRIAVTGYGNLGRSVACNLRDSGLDVVVGSREDPSAEQARADGFSVSPLEEAVETADVVWLALPDEVIAELCRPGGDLRPRPRSLLCFSSGYALAYDLAKPPTDVDVVLLAPRMVGARLRTLFLAGRGFYSFVGVEQDATGTAQHRLLALAKAVGTLRAGAVALSAATEAALDLYVEQTVGPLLGAAVLNAFEVGAANGLPGAALALELYMSGEMAATWDAFAEYGFFRAVRLHGGSAAYGGFLRLGEIDQAAMRAGFAATLADIRGGSFARQFQEELAAGSPTYSLIEAMTAGDDPLSRSEATVRSFVSAPGADG